MKNNNETEQEYVMRDSLAVIAKKGAGINNCGGMCKTCAFKKDSDANLEPHNVEAAWESLAYNGQFNCHIVSDVDAGVPCKGFLNAKQYYETLGK